jgi:hypothetical protein
VNRPLKERTLATPLRSFKVVHGATRGSLVAAVAMKPPVLNRRPAQRLPLKLFNVVGAGLQRLGVRVGDLHPEQLCREAIRKTGLRDWGGSEFHEPLGVFLEAVEKAPKLHSFGRVAVHASLVHALSNRLLLQAYWCRYPQVLQLQVKRPLFIMGAPRTGTTLLFNLLAQDPTHRPLLNWEASTPAPSPRQNRVDLDYKYAANVGRQLHYLLPDLRHKHDFGPDAPEECNILFLNTLESEILYFWYDVPHYRAWLNTRDRVGSYANYCNQLKLLQHLRPGHRWLLKSTTHIYSLAALLTVFPDACIIQTHRDPLKVLPSTCSLEATYRGLCYPVVDYARLADESAEQLSLGLTACRVERSRFPAHHFYDAHYRELVRDPIGVLKAIYRQFDFELGHKTVERMAGYLAANPQYKHGVHRYSLEEFGLDARRERARFGDYVNAYQIAEDA